MPSPEGDKQTGYKNLLAGVKCDSDSNKKRRGKTEPGGCLNFIAIVLSV